MRHKKSLLEQPRLAIIISIYRREERFFMCLDCLISAINYYKLPVQLIIMDNSPNSKLEESIGVLLKKQKLVYLSYIKDSNSNLSQLRNKALRYLNSSIKSIFLLDSDIYIAKKTLSIISSYLQANKQIKAIAPPLGSYLGGLHDSARKACKNKWKNLIMPNSHDIEKNEINGSFLQSHMLRGAFIIHRSFLNKHFGKYPWYSIFKVWQNVPFFLRVKELKAQFGYLMNKDIIALHDDRPHADTIRFNLKTWHAETIKSIILIFFMNKLWLKDQQKKNSRFIEVMKEVLSTHSNLEPIRNVEIVMQISKILSKDKTFVYAELRNFLKLIEEEEIKKAINLLLIHPWDEITEIHSKKYKTVM